MRGQYKRYIDKWNTERDRDRGREKKTKKKRQTDRRKKDTNSYPFGSDPTTTMTM